MLNERLQKSSLESLEPSNPRRGADANEMGTRYVRTHNDSENRSTLAANRKMGLLNQAERITFEKQP
jgi:hypothetical protein